eukprot:CAMPEP_0168610762 /NCGR_PEP_ID=MMETSP0449_2-20121227/1968_1 /TAXON_ID=1082188 /ORGANISM="Strombidium rassoulzadegani, Strain ras09" /LENGTH=68 /DNA_ID=CAMNT_0008651105 /DNA_START=167 /DNA_END=373 /DNA_ORIENTATION=+
MIRGRTFKRNFDMVEEKYGEEHRKAFGEDKQLSKFGYPDLGNNIYSDCLPYNDWVQLNNGQRCHENLV